MDPFDKSFLGNLGIVDWGYTEQSEPISYEHFQSWLSQSYHGKLGYLADKRADKRASLKEVYPDFESALVFLFDYRKQKKYLQEKKDHRIAGYALGFDGEDYHFVLRERLEKIALFLEINTYKMSIDMEPVLERDLAYRSGLGWFGKNSMLINKKEGSYFLIASLLLPKKLSLKSKEVESDHCGICTKCLDACPTDAITNERTLIANRCISTFTIETFKEETAPDGFKEEYYFGCDICQDICPWNHKPLEGVVPEVKKGLVYNFFLDRDNEQILEDLSKMSNRGYKRLFRGTVLERPGRIGMIKNLRAIKERTNNDNSHLWNK